MAVQLLTGKQFQSSLFVTVVVAGVDQSGKEYLASIDHGGNVSCDSNLVAAGTALKSLMVAVGVGEGEGGNEGGDESEKNDENDWSALPQRCEEAFMEAIERDCFSGNGGLTVCVARDGSIYQRVVPGGKNRIRND